MPKVKLEDKLFKIALEEIACSGWLDLNLSTVATKAQASLADTHTVFPTKMAIIDELLRRIDQEALANVDKFDIDETPQERLFSVIMTRFDVMSKYKDVLRQMWGYILKDPVLMLCSVPRGLNSMVWMLEIAGLTVSGWSGVIKVKLFAIFYLSQINTWLEDDSADMATTMANLDRGLKRFEQFPSFY